MFTNKQKKAQEAALEARNAIINKIEEFEKSMNATVEPVVERKVKESLENINSRMELISERLIKLEDTLKDDYEIKDEE